MTTIDVPADGSVANFLAQRYPTVSVAIGEIGNLTLVRKFGWNSDIDTAANETIWGAGGLYPWQSSAQSIEVLSSDAADAAAGNGMRTVKVQGLDSNHDEIEETATLNGVTPVALTATFLRIYRAFGVTAGTSGVNAGDITVRVASAGATQAFIPAGTGQTVQSIFTVPQNHTAVILGMEAGYTVALGAAETRVALMTRSGNENPCWRAREFVSMKGDGSSSNSAKFFIPVAEKADIELRCLTSDTNNVAIQGSFDLLYWRSA